ncbi:MAG: F0F1 ATP synthase subunit beta, partial [Armatimonadetes bacterium]|nr:F0F1 ATP synthase subunit beta [Armatimonadota bacterium]
MRTNSEGGSHGTATGEVIQVIGAIVDIRFPVDALPEIRDAIEATIGHGDESRRLVLEVALHLGNETVRCVAMAPTEGMVRGMAATSTGKPITVPVGPKVLGRLLNVLGEPIDGLGEVEATDYFPIHRPAPSFEDQEVTTEIFETGFKVVDLLAPYPRGGKVGLFGGAGVGKT